LREADCPFEPRKLEQAGRPLSASGEEIESPADSDPDCMWRAIEKGFNEMFLAGESQRDQDDVAFSVHNPRFVFCPFHGGQGPEWGAVGLHVGDSGISLLYHSRCATSDFRLAPIEKDANGSAGVV
jgi:hypothetical protein